MELLPEWQVRYNETFLDSLIFLAEAMPGASICWGAIIATVPVLAGGDYEYGEDSSHVFFPSDRLEPAPTVWIKRIPEVLDCPLPSFDRNHPLVGTLENIILALVASVKSRGYVNPPIMLDALTTLSLFRSPEQLCKDLLEMPEKVVKWCNCVTDLYINAYEHFYRRIRRLGYGGETSSWLRLMAEGRCEAVQCDFAVLISPEMFQKFVLHDLQRLTEYLDYSLYHLDGTCQLRFPDQLAGLPKLNGIQWNPEPTAGSPVDWIDSFKEIRRRNLSLHVGCRSLDEALLITKELGPDGLMIELPLFDTAAEAESAVQAIAKVC
jgi:hypothetical protein